MKKATSIDLMQICYSPTFFVLAETSQKDAYQNVHVCYKNLSLLFQNFPVPHQHFIDKNCFPKNAPNLPGLALILSLQFLSQNVTQFITHFGSTFFLLSQNVPVLEQKSTHFVLAFYYLSQNVTQNAPPILTQLFFDTDCPKNVQNYRSFAIRFVSTFY